MTFEEAVSRGRRQRRRQRAVVAAVTVVAVGVVAVSFAATRPSDKPRLNVAEDPTPMQPTVVEAARCTAADLRRPWPPMPVPKHIVKRFKIDDGTRIDPAGDVRPRVSAERAWATAKAEMTNPDKGSYPPGGGTGSIVFGYVESKVAVPASEHRLAWVVILSNTAQNVLTRGQRASPPPDPPCWFGHALCRHRREHGRVGLRGRAGWRRRRQPRYEPPRRHRHGRRARRTARRPAPSARGNTAPTFATRNACRCRRVPSSQTASAGRSAARIRLSRPALLNLRSSDNGSTWTVTDTGFGHSPRHAGDQVDINLISASTATVRLRGRVADSTTRTRPPTVESAGNSAARFPRTSPGVERCDVGATESDRDQVRCCLALTRAGCVLVLSARRSGGSR